MRKILFKANGLLSPTKAPLLWLLFTLFTKSNFITTSNIKCLNGTLEYFIPAQQTKGGKRGGWTGQKERGRPFKPSICWSEAISCCTRLHEERREHTKKHCVTAVRTHCWVDDLFQLFRLLQDMCMLGTCFAHRNCVWIIDLKWTWNKII